LPHIRAPTLGVEAVDPKRLQRLPQLLQHRISAPATPIRSDCATIMINRLYPE
jgi:hypothetical protein